MSIFDDPLYSDIFQGSRLASDALGQASLWQHHPNLFELSTAQNAVTQWHREHETLGAIIRDLNHIARFSTVSELTRTPLELFSRELITPVALGLAQEHARIGQSLVLPFVLEGFRTSVEPLSSKFLTADLLGVGDLAHRLSEFTSVSAYSDLIGQSMRVDRDLMAATEAFKGLSFPAFDTLARYGNFLDAAGLHLPHWPKLRLLSTAEKRRRFKARLRDNGETPHVKRAKSLVHRYELTLREVLDAAMADTYGEDWAETRLKLCDCKGLLGRWKSRGGEILDHADYTHYGLIMSHPEHFTAIFEAGFEDPEALLQLMKDAGRLRAASHHGGKFTADDLRDLRVTWRTIETGLLAFTADYETDLWG